MREQTVPVRNMVCFAILLAVPVVGCGSEAGDDNGLDGAWEATAVVEELSIGVESGADEYMLGGVRDVAVAADGRIFAYQLSPRAIREFDADGNFLREIGREGQGPGEYQSPALEVIPDGRLATWDVFNNRLTLYAHDGTYDDGIHINASLGGAQSLGLDREGNFYIRDWERTDEPVMSEADIPVVLRKHTPAGERLESVPLPNRARDESEGISFTMREGFTSFPVETLSAWSPLGYVVAGRNDRYSIELLDPTATITIGRAVEPVALGADELDEWNAFRAYTIVLNADRGPGREYAPIPTTKPFFKALHAGLDGRIWVHRYAEAIKRDDVQQLPEIAGRPAGRPLLTWREPPSYDVFEPDGTFLGTVVLPDDFTPHVFRGDQVWGVHLDQDGVERIKRLRVEHS